MIADAARRALSAGWTVPRGGIVFTGRDTPLTAEIDTPEVYEWTVPTGVTAITAVLVGAGGFRGNSSDTSARWGGAGGGGLRWISDLPVTPGEMLTVHIYRPANLHGAVATGAAILRGETVLVWAGRGRRPEADDGAGPGGGGSPIGAGPDGSTIGGGNGGTGRNAASGRVRGGGGGAAGYLGNGGAGATDGAGTVGSSPQVGSGGASGGASSSTLGIGGTSGGGVGLYGHGADAEGSGQGGSGGGNGGTYTGGIYGGGLGAGWTSPTRTAGPGAVRIVWGPGRAFPSTDVADAGAEPQVDPT